MATAIARTSDEAGFSPARSSVRGASAYIDPVFRQSMEVQRLGLYGLLALVDLAALLLAFCGGSLVRYGQVPLLNHLDLLALLAPMFLGAAALSQAYSLSVLENPRHSVTVAVRALVYSLAALIGMMFYLKTSTEHSRIAVAVASILAVLFVAAGRYWLGKAIGRRFDWHFVNELLLVDDVASLPAPGQRVAYASAANVQPSRDDPFMLDRIAHLAQFADRVLISCSPARRDAWSATMKAVRTNVEIMAPELDSLGALAIRRERGRTSLLVSNPPLSLRNRLIKRSFDLAVAVPAFLCLLPLFVAIAAAIRLESKGPVFFRQARVGRSNKLFHVLKFRSMRIERSDSDGSLSASRDDDRITRVGRILRRTSLDELPQLINVLIGQMSLVGPRPHALKSTAEDALFWEIDGRYWDRHSVKPGITGLAQVRGFRGATWLQSDLVNRLQADIEYVSNWSLGRDIRILFRTVKVLVHPNAF